MTGLLERLVAAQNARDAAAFAASFAEDYRSESPVHPDRGFTGRARVLENWSSVFAGVPDFHAELVASNVDGDVEWGELDWSGRHVDGTPFAMRGVIIATVHDDRIAAARLYLEPVDQDRTDIAEAVQDLYRPPSDSA